MLATFAPEMQEVISVSSAYKMLVMLRAVVIFKRFYAEAYELITNIPEDGNPYGAEEELAKQGDYDVVHLSAVPKMYFTATTYTLAEAGNGCSYPFMTSGKAVTREGRLVFPLSIYVNHAFVDGSHLASFFQKIEEHLKRISQE